MSPMSLMTLFESVPLGAPQITAEQKREISMEVIDAVNREFPASLLQDPGPAGTARVNERILVLVGQALERRQLASRAEVSGELARELSRRLLGLGFLDLLLPPVRTDLSEITLYSSGLVQVMKKGSVRWETVALDPIPEEIGRVLDRLLGPQNRSLNETNPSVNARLPRTADNPGGGRVKALHPVIAPPGRNPSINIRLFEQKPVDPEWLLARQLMSPEMMADLALAMQKGAAGAHHGGDAYG